VCLSIWTEDHSHDLMWKVTDVCDPKDCPTPLDIKVEPYKVGGWGGGGVLLLLWLFLLERASALPLQHLVYGHRASLR
jgi:hypothetical protein